MRIEYHRTLIADQVRNEAFHAALKRTIIPGKSIVADIGAGTGLLGLFASKLGAKEVFLFEAADVAGVAKKVLSANRARNCHLIPCHSTEFGDRLSVDIIVSETLGNYALEENIVDTLNDARKRFLKAGGIVIPSAIEQFVAPVVSPRIETELQAWRRVGHGLDLGVAETMSRNNAYVRLIAPAELLDRGRSATTWDRIDLTHAGKSARKGTASWRLNSAETIHGFAIWWRASLVPSLSLSLSTAPDAPRTHWEQLYLPLLEPIETKPGDSVAVQLRSTSSERDGTNLSWTAMHLDGKNRERARQTLDLNKGFLP